jgi:hypothetical protein
MKQKLIVTILMLLGILVPSLYAVDIPHPPDLTAVIAMIERPDGSGNAADYYLEAEKKYRESTMHAKDRELVSETSEAYKLVLKGMACASCEFPYSRDMTIPPYQQMIPMMALYRSVARTFRKNGDDAFEKKSRDLARNWYAKAVNLGLHLWEEPGVTIIQDMIALAVIAEGVEGLGDVFIANGDADGAARCARFLAGKTRYLECLPRFVKDTLRGGDGKRFQVSSGYREVARRYGSITYTPLKIEILLTTAEIMAFPQPSADREICERILNSALKDPDQRVRVIAEWAVTLDKDKIEEMETDLDALGSQ